MPGQLLRARRWDDEFVVYNDLSGDTHLIDAAAMAMLLALQAAPAGLVLAGAADGAPDALDEPLGTLETIALIECAGC